MTGTAFSRRIVALVGALAAVAALAGPARADQCINDDLIVDGSTCIGFDCVCGESFGFDTLRLKENNLRIHFDDTSTALSFPRRDWRLVANDSSNGGAEYFAIEDSGSGNQVFRVEAGARRHALYVESDGDIGIGTSNPVLDLHVVTGNTPALRLDQDGSSGFTPQIWDVAGNDANFFVRDVTGGSRLPLRIRPGAPSNSLVVAANGNIGMGTLSPDADADLEIEDNGVVRITLDNTSAGVTWVFQNVNTGDFRVSDVGDAVSEFNLDVAGNLTVSGDYFSATCVAGMPCAPDYVFGEDYELMPLAELERFVAEARHLPNVPSANELRAAGRLNLSRFQMTLLEKIEELTLYTLDQQRGLDRLAAENAELRARLEAVEAAVGR